MSGRPAVIPSPNIWQHPDVYELENRGVDPAGRLEDAMMRVLRACGRGWAGARVLDIGCGTGFHLPRFARLSGDGSVVGVEPHEPLTFLAARRLAVDRAPTAAVVRASAQALPLGAASVEVAHARWAYFFGPGCEPGLAELDRVMAPGGVAFVIDNDAGTSTFGSWFRRAWPAYDSAAVQRFWARKGWQREDLMISWTHATRADFEAVVRIEFAPDLVEQLLAEHAGTSVDYAVHLFWRQF